MSNAEHDFDPEARTESTDNSACRRDGGEPDEPETAHLDNVDDGCGCTEIWEHLSEQRSG